MAGKEFFNLEDIEKMLDISERTALRYLKAGELKGFKVGREWRFTQADINAFVERQRQKVEKRETEQPKRTDSLSREDDTVVSRPCS